MRWACHRRRKRRLRLPCLRGKRGMGYRGMFRRRRARREPSFWVRSVMGSTPRCLRLLMFASALLVAVGCGRSRPDPDTVTMLIESSPTNLDPRIGTDAQAEHIDPLIFDSLVKRNAHFG